MSLVGNCGGLSKEKLRRQNGNWIVDCRLSIVDCCVRWPHPDDNEAQILKGRAQGKRHCRLGSLFNHQSTINHHQSSLPSSPSEKAVFIGVSQMSVGSTFCVCHLYPVLYFSVPLPVIIIPSPEKSQ
ncbi:hypothetical protein FJZ31_09750 [Candidatus Poribacteria bacterium]|nr:hypothetical protein [Candidatus Poribacteria bacterium]